MLDAVELWLVVAEDDTDDVAVLDTVELADDVTLVVTVDDADDVPLVVAEVVAELVAEAVAVELADVVADDVTDVVTLLVAVDVTEVVTEVVTELVSVELTLLVAVDETVDDALDETDVVADDVTVDDTVLDTVDVCVVCSHSKKVPFKWPLIALLTRCTVASHLFRSAMMKPSIVQSSVESLSVNPSAKMALPAILFTADATAPHSALDAPEKIRITSLPSILTHRNGADAEMVLSHTLVNSFKIAT